jgi:hypothetical protein
MRWSGGIGHACKFAGVVACALVLAACSRQGQPREYGLGATDLWPRRARREFAVNVGDLVHFQEDSAALSGGRKASCATLAHTDRHPSATGARRAAGHVGETFLAQVGVNAARMRTISWQERPVRSVMRHLLDAESPRPDGAEQRRRRPFSRQRSAPSQMRT